MRASERVVLAGEILAAYARARRRMRHVDVREVVRVQHRLAAHRPQPPEARREGLTLGGAVSRTLSMLPMDSRCLVRSIVLLDLLARRGIAGTLVIGARPDPTFTAHAWVELDGEPLLPPGEYAERRLVEI